MTSTAAAPSAATTGVEDGVTLRSMSGGWQRAKDTTIENKVIKGDVTFAGSNLTLRNVRITGEAIFRGDNLVIEDSEFGTLSLSGTDTVRAERLEITGSGKDGIHITSDTGRAKDVRIADSWVHTTKSSGFEGMHIRGVQGLTLDNVLVDLADRPLTAAIFLQNANGGNRDVTVRDSVLLGGQHVLHTVADDVSITGTVIDSWTRAALHPSSRTITEFSGNTLADGTPLQLTTHNGKPAILPGADTKPEPEPEPEPQPEPEPEPEPQPVGTPGPSNTGVRSGATLTPMSGGWSSAKNTTIENKVINGNVTFAGSNLTLRNVRITGEAIFRGDNLVIEDSEFGALSLSGTAKVRIDRVEVFGVTGKDGFHITSDTGQVSDVRITNSWAHSPKVTASSHYDGMQVRGVHGLTLDNVRIDLGAHKPQYTAALFLENANGGNRDVTVRNSQLIGGGYVFYSFADNVTVVDTIFDGGNWGTLFPSSHAHKITEFSGNTLADGTPLQLTAHNGKPAILPVR